MTNEEKNALTMGLSSEEPAAEVENPEDEGSLKIWQEVPEGAILELRVVSTNPLFAVAARFVPRQGMVEIWPKPDIHPGPKRKELHVAQVGYVLSVIIAFDSNDQQPVDIFAQILVNGVVFDAPYFHRVTGQRGDVDISKIFINML